jgi:acyl-CoA thioester hydrolase
LVSEASSAAARITVERRVEWSDTDGTGHQHFTAVLRWAEQAETLLCERLGVAERTVGHMPRVRVEVDYARSVFPGEIVEIDVQVARVGRTSVGFEFVMRAAGGVAASGSVVAVLVEPGGRAIPWPDDVRRAFLEAGDVPGERYAVAGPGG